MCVNGTCSICGILNKAETDASQTWNKKNTIHRSISVDAHCGWGIFGW